MKKSLFLMMLLASFAGFSQAISVNTSQYTATELVNNVLISSPCTSGQNVVARTGTNFGSTNGIGYFENTSSNPNFPFAKGVVLSTGDVTKIPGVNPATPNTTTLSDGSMAWTGDTDLQNILLSQSGITFNSINASYLEFDFTPLSASFSFDFVFASEEYGALQCNFSDAFAFILTDLNTGISKNLAVVAGNSPISVATIRNALYNPSCASVNAGFFGAYNGSGFGPAINFNGQTVKMTASSVVDITHDYKIKLVIADGVDSNNNPSPLYDSAVFFGANTFNIGTEVLGLDYTSTNASVGRDAICPGTPMPTLGSVTPLPPGTVYKWLKDGVEYIPAQTGPTLNLQALGETTTHTYTLIYTKENCQDIPDDILVEVYSPINAPQPKDLYKSCEASAPTHSFDLAQNTTFMMASLPADTVITYYATQSEANSGVGTPLSIPYTVTHAAAVSGVTVYVRIKSGSSPCFETKSFTLKYTPSPVINIPNISSPAVAAILTKCATNYPAATPRAGFAIGDITPLILGTQDPAAYVVKYYLTYAASIDPTATPLTNLNNQFTRDIFVRVELIGNPGCFAVMPASNPAFAITVTPKAPIDTLQDVLVCTSSTGYQLPALTDPTSEYWSASNGPSGSGTELDTPAETLVNTSKQIYIYNNPGGNLCSNESSFNVVKVNLTTWTASIPATACTHFILPELPYGIYLPNIGPPSATNVEIAPGTDITTTTTLYVYVESIGLPTVCADNKQITINIVPFVEISQASYPNQFACSSYILGTNMTANPQVTYWTGPNKSGTQKFFGDAISTNNTFIYAYQEAGICNHEVSFTVYIGAAGNLNVPGTAVLRCNGYSLTASPIGEYHTASFMDGGGTQILPAPNGQVFFNEVGTHTYWLYVPGQPCTYNISFTVTNQLATMPEIADVPAQCDFYILPPNPYVGASYYEGLATNNIGTGTFVADNNNTQNYVVTGEGVHHFYLHIDGPGNGCQENEEFTVTISNTPVVDVFADAVADCNSTTYTLPTLTHPGAFYNQPGGVGPISGSTITAPSNTGTSVRTVYVYQAGSTPACFGEDSFTVSFSIVNVEPVTNKYTCDVDYVLPPINGVGDYYDAPGGPAGTGSIITAPIHYTQPPDGSPVTTTVYVYADDGAPVPCRDEESFTVTQYAKPAITVPGVVNQCGSFFLPAYNTITTVPPNAVNHYYTGDDGTGTELFPGDEISVATPVYIYAGVIGGDAALACFTDEVWNINVTPYPVITPAVGDLSGCDLVVLDPLTVGTYYNDAAHTDPITNMTLTASQTVYVYAVNNPGNCETPPTSFEVTVTESPVVTINDADATIESCDFYTIPAYNDPLFSTTTGAIDHFYLSSGAEVFPGNTINTSDVITVEAHNTNACPNITPVTLTVNISTTPTLDTLPPTLSDCDHVQLPALTVGNYYSDAAHTSLITNTDLTTSQTVYIYAESPTNPNCAPPVANIVVTVTPTPVLVPADYEEVFACDSYTLPALATAGAGYFSGTNGTGPIAVGTIYNTDTAVYVYASNGNGCDDQELLAIHVYKVDDPADFTACFDAYPLPSLTTPGANYYTGPNGTGTMMPAGTLITSTQTVYVYGVNPDNATCSSERSFLITKMSPAVANPVTDPALTTVCDSDANPDDFVTMIDLDSFTASVLGSQSPTEYTVTYYASAIDASMQTNALTTDGTPAPDAAYNPIFTRVQNTTGCHEEGEILINVVPQPHIDADLSGIICIDPDTGEITPAYIESGYPGGNGPGSYSFEWTDADGVVVATTPNLQTTEAGIYSLVVRANGVSMCESAPVSITIIESARPASVQVDTTGWFTDHQTITVVAIPYIGTGDNFVYSLDGMEPQDTYVFTDVPAGVHEILVSDKNGCGATPAPFSVELVSSPPYFTPNGDGINDVWRLNGITNIPTGSVSDIQIFDRYGKLVSQITADGPGWDGSLNGQPLPATDYWFSLKYLDPVTNTPKEYKSHFALVR